MIENNIWLRTAATSDMQAIYEILQESWHAAYDDLIGHDLVANIVADWYDPVSLSQDINHPGSEYIVADDGTKLFGVAHALSGALEEAPDTVLIRQLCVRPSSQNQGIGNMLLQELETAFPYARHFRVMVLEKNECACAFFTQRGYERRERDKQVLPASHLFEVMMEKEMK